MSDARFIRLLKKAGWTQIESWEYAKGNWRVLFDTSSWMIVSTGSNPRTSDVHVPGGSEAGWTVNLIEHLCKIEDERYRLREAIAGIRDDPASGTEVQSSAAAALEQCYHTWLVDTDVPMDQPGRLYCPVCGQREGSRPSMSKLT